MSHAAPGVPHTHTTAVSSSFQVHLAGQSESQQSHAPVNLAPAPAPSHDPQFQAMLDERIARALQQHFARQPMPAEHVLPTQHGITEHQPQQYMHEAHFRASAGQPTAQQYVHEAPSMQQHFQSSAGQPAAQQYVYEHQSMPQHLQSSAGQPSGHQYTMHQQPQQQLMQPSAPMMHAPVQQHGWEPAPYHRGDTLPDMRLVPLVSQAKST